MRQLEPSAPLRAASRTRALLRGASRTQALLRAACCALALLVTTIPARAAGTVPHFPGFVFPDREVLPHIADVRFSAGSGSGSVAATINGTNFGPVPGGIPCSLCTPVEVQVLDLTADGNPQPITVSAWSDTSISLDGIVANPGDALEIDVYNDTIGNAAAWGGLVSRLKGVPKITSIQTSGMGQALTVTVNGSGFGPAPTEVGQNTNSPFFMLSDINNGTTGTGGARWNAGYCGAYECDGVTMGYVSWTDTQIVMSTFGSQYGNSDWFINPGDAFCIGVWPSTSYTNGTTGGTAKCARLPKK
jgi:hypothetical protein